MELRDAIKCVLEHDLSVEGDRGIISSWDEESVVVEYDGGDAPVHQEQFSAEDTEVAIDVFIGYIQGELPPGESLVNWIKEGF